MIETRRVVEFSPSSLAFSFPGGLRGRLFMVVLMTHAWQSVGAEERVNAQFENEIRPLLIKHCVQCHGAKQAEAGLRLDSRAGLAKGGESGPAVLSGRSQQSLIVRAVRHEGGIGNAAEQEAGRSGDRGADSVG